MVGVFIPLAPFLLGCRGLPACLYQRPQHTLYSPLFSLGCTLWGGVIDSYWLSRPRMVLLHSCTLLVYPNPANTFKNHIFIKFSLVYLLVLFVSCQNLDWCKASNNNHHGVTAEFCHSKFKMTRSTSYWHGGGPKELRASKSLLLE